MSLSRRSTSHRILGPFSGGCVGGVGPLVGPLARPSQLPPAPPHQWAHRLLRSPAALFSTSQLFACSQQQHGPPGSRPFTFVVQIMNPGDSPRPRHRCEAAYTQAEQRQLVNMPRFELCPSALAAPVFSPAPQASRPTFRTFPSASIFASQNTPRLTTCSAAAHHWCGPSHSTLHSAQLPGRLCCTARETSSCLREAVLFARTWERRRGALPSLLSLHCGAIGLCAGSVDEAFPGGFGRRAAAAVQAYHRSEQPQPAADANNHPEQTCHPRQSPPVRFPRLSAPSSSPNHPSCSRVVLAAAAAASHSMIGRACLSRTPTRSTAPAGCLCTSTVRRITSRLTSLRRGARSQCGCALIHRRSIPARLIRNLLSALFFATRSSTSWRLAGSRPRRSRTSLFSLKVRLQKALPVPARVSASATDARRFRSEQKILS